MGNLLEISKIHIASMLGHTDVSKDDFTEFYEHMENYAKIDNMEIKPYLVIIHSNMWEILSDFKDEVMEYLGYEYIGRMGNEYQDNEKYIFECEDVVYDCLYRLISPKADYTKTIKF